MRTEAILSGMERAQKKRKRKRIFRKILRELLRGSICMLGGALIVMLGVPVMEMLMQSWGSRVFIKAGVCYFGILLLVSKVYPEK